MEIHVTANPGQQQVNFQNPDNVAGSNAKIEGGPLDPAPKVVKVTADKNGSAVVFKLPA